MTFLKFSRTVFKEGKLFKSTCLRILKLYKGLHFIQYKFAIKKEVLLLRVENKLCFTINREFEIFTHI